MREAHRPLDVTIGEGTLAGKGVYAARAFEQGELVVPYALRELTQAEFDDLPPGEWEWTHSFHGRIYLFSEPERYVNHSDDPSTYPDHARGGNVALRSIQKGEAVTIDDRRELQYELDTFLGAYEDACNNREFTALAPLIADDAVYWLADGTRVGKAAIQDAFEDAWSGSHDRANILCGCCVGRCQLLGLGLHVHLQRGQRLRRRTPDPCAQTVERELAGDPPAFEPRRLGAR